MSKMTNSLGKTGTTEGPAIPLGATGEESFFCASNENIRELRPLRWMLLLALAALYLGVLQASPILMESPRLIVFTGLMVVHAGLHWVGPYLTTRRGWLLPYLVVQGSLVFTIGLLVGAQMVMFGLYLALIGQSVGIIENLRISTIVVVGYLALSGINFASLWGWTSLPLWFASITPTVFFITVYVAVFIRQATSRERARTLLRDLESAHYQLQEYALQVEELTVSQERQRMARELHDTLAQGLAGLILQLEAVDSHLESANQVKAQEVTQKAMRRARLTLDEARRAIQALRSSSLEHGDLIAALRREVVQFAETTGVSASFEVGAGLPVLSLTAVHDVLRIVQECLANISQHASASEVWVRMSVNFEEFRLVVEDNGAGFDPVEHPGRFGLVGMRERAQGLGGILEVESKIDKGTKVTLVIPGINNKVEGLLERA